MKPKSAMDKNLSGIAVATILYSLFLTAIYVGDGLVPLLTHQTYERGFVYVIFTLPSSLVFWGVIESLRSGVPPDAIVIPALIFAIPVLANIFLFYIGLKAFSLVLGMFRRK